MIKERQLSYRILRQVVATTLKDALKRLSLGNHNSDLITLIGLLDN
jgi:hypothetical protein